MCAIWLPFAEAFDAGLWLFWITETEILAVPRPSVRIEADRLHCADGPAVAWPTGEKYFFWHGVQVGEDVVLRPESITPAKVDSERNAEVRRVLLERFGPARYLQESGAQEMHRDERGILYRKELAGDEPLVMVEVINSTPEPDGSLKRYWLRVPPTMRTASEAVAWTFGIEKAAQYAPRVET
jgi:hypothetical protein